MLLELLWILCPVPWRHRRLVTDDEAPPVSSSNERSPGCLYEFVEEVELLL